MARPPKKRTHHRGRLLPPGVYPQRDTAGELAGYKIRWREENAYGLDRHSAKTFSVRTCGSLDEAWGRRPSIASRRWRSSESEGSVLRADPAEKMTLEELFAEWRAAMGFTIAARPSEWLHSATWGNLHGRSVELQRADDSRDGPVIGLKTGARAALVLGSAHERLAVYRSALEDRFGSQPLDGLVFLALGPEGPIWIEEEEEGGRYRSPGITTTTCAGPPGCGGRQEPALRGTKSSTPRLASMRFYDCRHTAISMALHSTLVVDSHGMNLHSLAAWAGHDVQTLQRHYAHVIACYYGMPAIDLEEECAAARQRVEAEPAPIDWPTAPSRELRCF